MSNYDSVSEVKRSEDGAIDITEYDNDDNENHVRIDESQVNNSIDKLSAGITTAIAVLDQVQGYLMCNRTKGSLAVLAMSLFLNTLRNEEAVTDKDDTGLYNDNEDYQAAAGNDIHWSYVTNNSIRRRDNGEEVGGDEIVSLINSGYITAGGEGSHKLTDDDIKSVKNWMYHRQTNEDIKEPSNANALHRYNVAISSMKDQFDSVDYDPSKDDTDEYIFTKTYSS